MKISDYKMEVVKVRYLSYNVFKKKVELQTYIEKYKIFWKCGQIPPQIIPAVISYEIHKTTGTISGKGEDQVQLESEYGICLFEFLVV